MDEFTSILTSFPTVVFSFALIFVCVFWLLAAIGLADIDLVDLDFDISSETDASGFGALSGLLMRWGLAGIPVSVIVSVLVVFCWVFCYFGTAYLLVWLPGTLLKIIGGMVLIGLCLMVAFPITALSLRPMKDVFAGESAISNADLIGRQCEVRSGEVSEAFGQGVVDDGGSGYIVDIRATEPNEIKRGEVVAIVAYDATTGTYRVIPEKEFMAL